MTPQALLDVLASHSPAMQVLDSGACTVEHVSRRNPDGPDERLDNCPCGRSWAPGEVDALPEEARRLLELGGGQYVSSPRHTLADLVRDLVGG